VRQIRRWLSGSRLRTEYALERNIKLFNAMEFSGGTTAGHKPERLAEDGPMVKNRKELRYSGRTARGESGWGQSPRARARLV